MYDLPIAVEIDGVEHNIRNKCDYRVILDCLDAITDMDLPEEYRFDCALRIFYEDAEKITNLQEAAMKMNNVINCGQEDDSDRQEQPRLMDWNYDFPVLAPAVNRVLGYDVRTPNKYTHWWTLVGAYMEIGESYFSNIVSIRSKKAKHKKLEKWEQEFYNENRKRIDLPLLLTAEEKAELEEEW